MKNFQAALAAKRGKIKMKFQRPEREFGVPIAPGRRRDSKAIGAARGFFRDSNFAVIFFRGSFDGFETVVVLRAFDAFFDEPFIVAAAFVVFIFTASDRNFVSGRAGQRVPAFGFGRGFENRFLRVKVRFAGQFAPRLREVGFRHVVRGTAFDHGEFFRAGADHLARDGADASGIFGQRAFFQWIRFHKLKSAPARKGPGIVRRFHFARAAILARVARLGKRVVAFFGFGAGGRLGLGAQAMERLLENGRLRFLRTFGTGFFHEILTQGFIGGGTLMPSAALKSIS
jgi:hypothetical protein